MFTTPRWLCGWGALLLLGACEHQKTDASVRHAKSTYALQRAKQAPPPSAFSGIDPQDYDIAKAERKFGRFVLVPSTDPEYSAFSWVFYQPHPGSAWQQVEGFKFNHYGDEPSIDTVNIDQKGEPELIVRSQAGSYGSGGGTTCYTLSIFRCENDVTKVLTVSVLYTDEMFGADEKSIAQSVRPQRGHIRVGGIKKRGLDCEESDCEGCGPHLKPGIYRLVGDTVIRTGI